jgi:hypothetical protein
MRLAVIVHPANVQDRDGAEPLLRQAQVRRTARALGRGAHHRMD